MKKTAPIVFLVDVDDTLLDNDRIQVDFKRHIEREFGARCRDQFWTIQDELFNQLSVERIADLLSLDLPDFLSGRRTGAEEPRRPTPEPRPN